MIKAKNIAKKIIPKPIKKVVKKVLNVPVKMAENALRTTRNLNQQNAQKAIDSVNKNKRPY